MANSGSTTVETETLQAQRALSRWDNEGGGHPYEAKADIHKLTNAELVHLRIRVIALENLVITLLAEGSDRQLAVVQDMAKFISPRVGFTPHPLTIKATDHMTDMANRAATFRTV